MRLEVARYLLEKVAKTINGETVVAYRDVLQLIKQAERESDEALANVQRGMGILDMKKLENRMQWYADNVPTHWYPHADAYKAGIGICQTLLRQSLIDKFTTAERRAAEE